MNLKQFLDLMHSLDLCVKHTDGNKLEYIFTTESAVSKINNEQAHLLSQIIEKNWEVIIFEDYDVMKVSFDYEEAKKK